MHRLIRSFAAALLALVAGAAFAAYPERPITLIVPWGAGGGTDAVARFFGAYLEKDLGQPINVVNRTGGNGVVGHSAIAQAAPIDDTTPFASAWNRLVAASGVMDASAAAQEFTDLFIGVGRCDVNLHGSHWKVGAMMERPLAELRAELAALGLGRRADVVMLEDHLSALFETMRILVAGKDDRPPSAVAVQRDFFERQIGSWAFRCCAAIRESTIANYYRCVAEFAEQFMALDRDALAME